MGKRSRDKGKRGELEARDALREVREALQDARDSYADAEASREMVLGRAGYGKAAAAKIAEWDRALSLLDALEPETWWVFVEEDGSCAVAPFGLAGAGDNVAIYQNRAEAEAAEKSGLYSGAVLTPVTVLRRREEPR